MHPRKVEEKIKRLKVETCIFFHNFSINLIISQSQDSIFIMKKNQDPWGKHAQRKRGGGGGDPLHTGEQHLQPRYSYTFKLVSHCRSGSFYFVGPLRVFLFLRNTKLYIFIFFRCRSVSVGPQQAEPSWARQDVRHRAEHWSASTHRWCYRSALCKTVFLRLLRIRFWKLHFY